MRNNHYNEGVTLSEYDQRKDAEAFEKTKVGVKGLVDSGITRIPRMFQHPPETLIDYQQCPLSVEGEGEGDDDGSHLIPVIDMSNVRHDDLVDQVREAATEFGFFQVINHGAPVSLLDRLHDSVRAFHELPAEEKIRHYRRDIINTGTGFGFYSNHDLFQSKAACWRDTISVRLGPTPVNPEDIPAICRDEVIEWEQKVKEMAERLVGLLSEGLGLNADRLKGKSYLGRAAMMGHYYPYCPEPNKTVGNASHTDLGMLTILLQDQVGGLQVNHHDKWINLKSIPGALVINLGDLFQILSNDRYKSGEHRVYANPLKEPRVSVGTFFNPGTDDDLYGPLPELVSAENPALYKHLKFSDALTGLLITESRKNAMANYFRF